MKVCHSEELDHLTSQNPEPMTNSEQLDDCTSQNHRTTMTDEGMNFVFGKTGGKTLSVMLRLCCRLCL
jgi:hypothetical protein